MASMGEILSCQDSPSDREEFLIRYSREKCAKREEIDLEEGWDILQRCGIDVVTSLLLNDLTDQKPFGNKGYAALHAIGYSMCQNNATPDRSKDLYDRVNNSMEQFLRDHVVQPLLDPSLVGVAMLGKFSKAWHNHKIMTKWIQRLFEHMDRGYVLNEGGNSETLTSCSMKKFLNVAFGDTCGRVRAGALEMIDRERSGDEVDREQLKNCIEVFQVMGLCRGANSTQFASVDKMLKMPPELDVYKAEFEVPFLRSTSEYYEREGRKWREENTVPEYLRLVEKALKEEEQRVRWYLNPATESFLKHTVVHTLLSKPQGELVNRNTSGMYALLMDNKSKDLQLMFRLFQLDGVIEGVKPMTIVFQRYVEDQGNALREARRAEIKRLEAQKKKETLSDPTMIIGMIDLYRKVHDFCINTFENHIDFQKALKQAFQSFMNKDAGKYRNVDLLVAYTDSILKGHEGSDKLTETQMEEKLSATMDIFVFLSDKDMFAELYRDSLAKRLLNKKDTSMEIEKEMITKMKHLQGNPFTSKIEGMLQDHRMCKDTQTKFAEYLEANPNVLRDCAECVKQPSVQLLALNNWPTQPQCTCNIPPVMASTQRIFEDYYQELHSGKRKLLWQVTLGDAEIDGVFPKGRYRISVSTLQAVALDMFSQQTSPLTLEEVCKRVGTAEEVTKRILHSLSCNPKYRVVKKSGPGDPKKINVDDTFLPNSSFSSKAKRFTIPMASLDNIAQIKARIKEDRSHQIDAALVRTMKARKRMQHNALISEVAKQLETFKPELKDIRQRIEGLIEREFIKRTEADGQWTKEYDYLA